MSCAPMNIEMTYCSAHQDATHLLPKDHLHQNTERSANDPGRYLQCALCTYHELASSCQFAVADPHERVVILAFAKGGAVDVGGEEADGRKNAGVE